MGKKASASTALAIAEDVTPESLRPLIPFNRKFYSFDLRPVDDGGPVVVKAKAPMAITKAQFQTFCCSGSDKLWAPFISPTNTWKLKVKEGSVLLVCFDIEGVPEAKNFLFQIPGEVGTRRLPGLREEVLANPDAFDLRTNADGSVHSKDAKRVDALVWNQNDCSVEKDGVKKPTRPNPADNGWRQTSKAVERMLVEVMKAIQPPSAAKLANDKRTRDEELESACKVLKSHGFDFKLVPSHMPEVAYQLVFENTTKSPLASYELGDKTLLTRYAPNGAAPVESDDEE